MRPRSMPDSHANDWLRLALDLGVLPVAGFLRICTGSLTSCLTCTLLFHAAGLGSSSVWSTVRRPKRKTP
jgi:hypothetical protein